MTTDPSRQIWKAGVALSDAWLHFAEQAVREEHESKPGFTGTLQHLVSVAQSTRDGKKILSALQEVGKAHLDKVESRKLLQDMLIEVLATDHLIATGYSAKGANGTPVPIAPAFFAEASADWENSVVRLNGTTYERVRITDPAALGDGFVAPVRSVETVAPVEAAPVVEPAPVVADVAPVAEAIAPVALVSKPPKKDKPPKVKAKKDAGQTSKKAKRAAKRAERIAVEKSRKLTQARKKAKRKAAKAKRVARKNQKARTSRKTAKRTSPLPTAELAKAPRPLQLVSQSPASTSDAPASPAGETQTD